MSGDHGGDGDMGQKDHRYINRLAVSRRHNAGIMNAAIFNQAAGAVVPKVDAFRTDVVHFAIADCCVIGIVQHNTFLGICHL